MVQLGPGRSPRDQSKGELLTEMRRQLGCQRRQGRIKLHNGGGTSSRKVKERPFLNLLQCGSRWFHIQF